VSKSRPTSFKKDGLDEAVSCRVKAYSCKNGHMCTFLHALKGIRFSTPRLILTHPHTSKVEWQCCFIM